MRHESLFRRHARRHGWRPCDADKFVAWARDAETLLGMDLDDWWEADPRPEPPEALRWGDAPGRPEGRRERLGFEAYARFRDRLDHEMDRKWPWFDWPVENDRKGLRAGAGALEAGLRPEDGDAGLPAGMLGRGRDGALVAVHLVEGCAEDRDLLRLLAALRRLEADEALEGGGGAAVRGYLLANAYEGHGLAIVGETPGVAARFFMRTLEFADAGGTERDGRARARAESGSGRAP